MAGKLNQQVIGVEKSKATREILKEKIVTLNAEKLSIKPEIVKLIDSTKQLQAQVRYSHIDYCFSVYNSFI